MATVTEAPELGKRGRRLWYAVVDANGPPLTPTDLVLLEEACRLADRLDRLDRLLVDGGEWLCLHPLVEDGTVVRIVVDSALAEARQQQATLRGLLAELRQSRSTGRKPARGRGDRPAGGAGVPGVTDLTERIEARAKAQG